MSEHRYILEPYKGMSTRYQCPACKHTTKTFTHYIDTQTSEHINTNVGRCSRESNCGYHYTPKQYFEDNKHLNTQHTFSKPYTVIPQKTLAPELKQTSFIPVDVFKDSLKNLENNCFANYLVSLFGDGVASQLIGQYFIGTSNYWDGATIFWQIDGLGKIRTGKIMLYDANTGKRVKNTGLPVCWVHKTIKQPDFELKQCLFGEHLLKDKTKPIAIVESEKTAIIASVYLPEFIWLAAGNLNGLNAEKCRVLKGRSVVLFPDLKCIDKWSDKAKELSHITTFTVSDLLERKATESERAQGLDLADYLIRLNYKEFIKSEIPTKHLIKEALNDYQFVKPSIKESWEKIIKELEYYFDTVKLPTLPLKLNPYSTITNVSKFIDSHFATVKANNGKHTFLPYLNRLQELKQYLTINKN
ncbi:MAG TPA: DUF6371 domain-containing protein [Bacteroidia bacterium]